MGVAMDGKREIKKEISTRVIREKYDLVTDFLLELFKKNNNDNNARV